MPKNSTVADLFQCKFIIYIETMCFYIKLLHELNMKKMRKTSILELKTHQMLK